MRTYICPLLLAALLGPVLGQFDISIEPDLPDGDYEFEDSHALSSCKWNDPPDDAVNYRPCSTGICRGERGSYSRNGTVRFTKCRKHFILTEGYDRDTCVNGKWTSSGHKCLQCGKSRNAFNKDEEIVLIHYGRNSSRGDFPWMAGIYTVLDEGKWEQICGGILISPNLVLSAAHCFSISDRELQPVDVKIGLGKLFADIYNKEPGAVLANVKEIRKPERYVGLDHLYDLDIALVVLSQSVTITNNIMPACFDWDAKMKLQHEETGTLAGWGVTETGGRSSTLKWVYQKYIAYENCRTLIKPKDQKYVTHDKFCTSEVRGGKADRGDSGGGLTFIRDSSVHYVYGIVSTKVYGDERNTRLFTNLMDDAHRAWLLRHWRRLQVQHGVEECYVNQDCPRDEACRSGRCQDPCNFACGENTSCRIVNHLTTCACKPCHYGDPIKGCSPSASCGGSVTQPTSQGRKTYNIVTDKVNWFTAVQNCAQNNKRLATIKNAAEMKTVADLIDQHEMTRTTFWVGGNDLAEEGRYVWIDTHKPFTYFNFREGDPNNSGGNEDCVEVWNRSWNDIDCYRNEFYICESCSPGESCNSLAQSTSQRNKRYNLVTEKVNWFTAVQNCAQNNKRLATIKNAAEMKTVADLIDQHQMTRTTFWVGGNDLAVEGRFVWIDTNNPFTYFNFREGDPNNSGNEDCVEVWNRSWNDIDCYRNEFYICETI